jgi:hypothetical protein
MALEDMASFPKAPATTPYWRNSVSPTDEHRTTENLPCRADIVIIGAGFAGASVVHHLLEQHHEHTLPSIVVLEAREACSGATGRNGILWWSDSSGFTALISMVRRSPQARSFLASRKCSEHSWCGRSRACSVFRSSPGERSQSSCGTSGVRM